MQHSLLFFLWADLTVAAWPPQHVELMVEDVKETKLSGSWLYSLT